jgi:uncharacterized damage-inducible protein DinB
MGWKSTEESKPMEIFIEDYLSQLEGLHKDMDKLLENLPQEGLDWSPGEAMNSLSVIAVHVAGAERFWIGDVIGRDPSQRDREAEFRVKGMHADAIKGKLQEVLKHTRRILEPLSMQDLPALRVSPRDGREYTVGWCMENVLKHAGLHLGHMEITRQLWDQRT